MTSAGDRSDAADSTDEERTTDEGQTADEERTTRSDATGTTDEGRTTDEERTAGGDDDRRTIDGRWRLPGLADGATRWVVPPIVGGLVALVAVPPLAPILLLLAAAIVWFFRDPDRETPDAAVVAPADGHVTVLREDGDRVRVGVFMSPIDVHVTRAPADGRLVRLDHRPGGHWPAFSKASDRNERVEFTIDSPVGRVDGAMIAGTLARRAYAYPTDETTLDRGDRLGLIAFGSRTDLVLPPDYELSDVAVTRGEAVRAGETIVVD